MKQQRRRPVYFYSHSLHDGTILAAYPIRKPSKQELRMEHMRIDPDGVARQWASNGRNLSDVTNDTRTRFQDIIATNLNTRRAIRALVLPSLLETLEEVRRLHARLDRFEALLLQRQDEALPPDGEQGPPGPGHESVAGQ